LVKINKALYTKCFARHHRTAWERKHIIRLLEHLMYFQGVTHHRIVDMSYLFESVVQQRGTVLMDEAHPNGHFYIVSSSVFSIFQLLSQYVCPV
jgi:hypothetical protein